MAKSKLPKTIKELEALDKKNDLKLFALEAELDKLDAQRDKIFDRMQPLTDLAFAISDKLWKLAEKASEVK